MRALLLDARRAGRARRSRAAIHSAAARSPSEADGPLDRREVLDGRAQSIPTRRHARRTLDGYAARAMAADPDCLFCKIVAGEIPATRVDEDERTVAFMDINPATRGHLLVIPREHATDLLGIAGEDLAACARDGAEDGAPGRRAPRRRRRQPAQLVRVAGLADGLPLPPARHPALPRGPAAAAVDAGAGRRDEIAAAARELES